MGVFSPALIAFTSTGCRKLVSLKAGVVWPHEGAAKNNRTHPGKIFFILLFYAECPGLPTGDVQFKLPSQALSCAGYRVSSQPLAKHPGNSVVLKRTATKLTGIHSIFQKKYFLAAVTSWILSRIKVKYSHEACFVPRMVINIPRYFLPSYSRLIFHHIP